MWSLHAQSAYEMKCHAWVIWRTKMPFCKYCDCSTAMALGFIQLALNMPCYVPWGYSVYFRWNFMHEWFMGHDLFWVNILFPQLLFFQKSASLAWVCPVVFPLWWRYMHEGFLGYRCSFGKYIYYPTTVAPRIIRLGFNFVCCITFRA